MITREEYVDWHMKDMTFEQVKKRLKVRILADVVDMDNTSFQQLVELKKDADAIEEQNNG